MNMDKNWKLSVMTPVHNTRIDYLERAFASLKSQSLGFSDIQWVVLFHNCTQEYIREAKALFSLCPNIFCEVAEAPGTGVGYARNLCLERAKGKYLLFLDSDDELMPGMAEAVCSEMERYGADLGVFVAENAQGRTQDLPQDRTQSRARGRRMALDADPKKGTYVIRQDSHGKNQSMYGSCLFLWNRCFKRSLIRENHIRFAEDGPMGEDFLFTMDATAKAACILLMPQIHGYRHYIGVGITYDPRVRAQAMAYFRPGAEAMGLGELMAYILLFLHKEGSKRGLSMDAMLWSYMGVMVVMAGNGMIPPDEKERMDRLLQPLLVRMETPVMLNTAMQEDVFRQCGFLREFFGVRMEKYAEYLKYETIPEAILALYGESDKTAVICQDQSITYRELLSEARELARILKDHGVQKGDRIVLRLDRSVSLIVSVLGILYAGAAYVPVERVCPKERLSYILRNSGARFILDQDKLRQLREESGKEKRRDGSGAAEGGAILPALLGEDEFAVYYTSGSTGTPKGCAVHHRTYYHFAMPAQQNLYAFEVRENIDRCLSLFNFAFIGSSFDIFIALLCGKTLILTTDDERFSPALAGRQMLKSRAGALHITPSQLLAYAADSVFRQAMEGIRCLILGGEPLTETALKQIAEFYNGDILYNYGASEIAEVSASRVRLGEDIHIGQAVFGTKLYVLDLAGRPVPEGCEGELCVGGVAPQLGYYVGKQTLTEQKYTQKEGLGRIFHTGDRGILHADGRITIMGRLDNMRKLHGLRIELHEVELCMESFPGIERAAADIRGEEPDARLVAWYLAEEETEEKRLRDYMRKKLPAYMIPVRMFRLEAFPLNQNGKLDRRALSCPPLHPEASRFRPGPRPADQKQAADQEEKYAHFLMFRTIPEGISFFKDSEKTAVLCKGERLSYKDMIADADKVAKGLALEGVGRGDFVVLSMPRSVDFVTGLLGILYSGAAYVAVDPEWPEERLDYIVKDCKAAMVLTQERYRTLMDAGRSGHTGEIALPVLTGEDACAVYYTSGSTGAPKGTVTHHQVFYNEALPVRENLCAFETMERCEVFFSMGNFAYGATACDIFSCLFYGKTLALAAREEQESPRRMGELMLKTGADALLATPSMLLMLLHDETFARGIGQLKRLILTGEALSDHAAGEIEGYTKASIYDAFGASELRNYAFGRVLPGQSVKIDYLIPGARLLILTDDGQEAAAGYEGELCVGGASAQLGYYVGQETLTASKFSDTDRFGRIYHTGDLAVLSDNGQVRMTGRKDHLIKLHGQRLEPGEVERCMETFEGVRRAVVDVRGEGVSAALCAWYTADGNVDPVALRRHLSERLPVYMIPVYMMEMDELPLNDSGKLDKRALRVIESTLTGYVPPKTPTQEMICLCFRQVLETSERVGLEDNFFALGGDSLKAIRAVHILRCDFGLKTSTRDLFVNPTPGLLSRAVTQESAAGREAGGELPESAIPDELAPLLEDGNTQAILRASEMSKLYLKLKAFHIHDMRNVSRVRTELLKAFDETEFQNRLSALVARHPALRSDYVLDRHGTFWQIIAREKTPTAFYKDLRSLPAGAAERFVNGFWQVLKESGALFAAAYFRLPKNRGVLLLQADHTIADGMSLSILQNELAGSLPGSTGEDGYIAHRMRSVAAASDVPEFVRDYYANVRLSVKSEDAQQANVERTAQRICLSEEETKRLEDWCGGEGFTLFTWVLYCYGRALLHCHRAKEIWLMHLDSGRYGEWEDDLAVVGNLAAPMPVCIDENTTASSLQSDLLALGQYTGLADTEIFNRIDFRGCFESIISRDFGEMTPLIERSELVDDSDTRGNHMRIRDGRLCIELRHADTKNRREWMTEVKARMTEALTAPLRTYADENPGRALDMAGGAGADTLAT